MITVALGTEQFPFPRILEWIDQAIDDGFIPTDEEIFIQAGNTEYEAKHKNLKIVKLIPYQDLYAKYGEARLNIIHAGIGTFLDIAEQEKPLLIVPRDPKFSEHIDPHQLQFAEIAKNELHVPVATSYQEFTNALQSTTQKLEISSTNDKLVGFLNMILTES